MWTLLSNIGSYPFPSFTGIVAGIVELQNSFSEQQYYWLQVPSMYSIHICIVYIVYCIHAFPVAIRVCLRRGETCPGIESNFWTLVCVLMWLKYIRACGHRPGQSNPDRHTDNMLFHFRCPPYLWSSVIITHRHTDTQTIRHTDNMLFHFR